MKCPKCNSNVNTVEISIEGANQTAISHQCMNCDYFEFEKKSAANVVKELKLRN